MKVALTEQFLEDQSNLPSGLERKCRQLLSSLRKIEAKNIYEQALPGWRLHHLNSSPFVSLSLDMNYRVLCKIDSKIVFIHRVVKHDLADLSSINRNDNAPPDFFLEEVQLQPCDLFGILVSLGISEDTVRSFQNIKNDDQLIEALAETDSRVANIALALYETTGLVIPRTRFKLLQNDRELEAALSGKQETWEIYLHPSQSYIVNLPPNARLIVSGSAGTGKTICAWYRLKYLTEQRCKVGFVCSNKSILLTSRDKVGKLLKDSPIDAYFLVPGSSGELLKLAESVDHIVIDEGQEFPPTWYELLADFLKKYEKGLTLFYDLNQLGGNIKSGDTKRYKSD